MNQQTIIEISERIATLSDELNDPNGLLSVSLANSDRKADERHEELKRFMRDIMNEIIEVRSRVDVLESNEPERITVQ